MHIGSASAGWYLASEHARCTAVQLGVQNPAWHGKVWQVTDASALQGVLTVGDYNGVVSQMDVSSGHLLASRDDHSGQRWGAFNLSCRNVCRYRE